MSIRTTLVIAGAIAVIGSSADTARADDKADCSHKLERSYTRHYWKVVRQHGRRAPGRNIRQQGVLFKGNTFEATCGEIKRSLSQLKALLTPAPYPTLNKVAVPPAQPPSGVESASNVAGGTLQAIAQCESGGNASAVNASGTYRGKYQFDYGTWASVGGSGDPAAASEAEQDMRAAMLYAQRGSAPWPVCGQ